MKIVTTSKNRLIMRLALAVVFLSCALVVFGLRPGAKVYAAEQGPPTDAVQAEAVQADESNDSTPENDQAGEEVVADEAAYAAAPEEEVVADDAALASADPTPTTAAAAAQNEQAAEPEEETAAEETTDAGRSTPDVYVDGQNGDDNNDGTSADKPVKSWGKVKELIGENGVVYVCGRIALKDGDVISTPAGQVVKSMGVDPMFSASYASGIVFKNVVFDGEGKNGRLLNMTKSTVSFNSGAVIKNFYYKGNGGAVYCESGTINVDGAKFLNNTATGYGGAIYQCGGSTIVVRSGRFEGNTAETGYGGAINQWSSADKAYIYNAVFTDNTAKNGGAIANCESGSNVTLKIDGAAIYDNTATSKNGSDDIYTRGNEKATVIDEMLGGGEHNWEHKSGSSGWKSNPDPADKVAALAAAVTVFINNSAPKNDGGAIRSNGEITMGRAQDALEVIKVDSKTGESLDGVKFTLSGRTVDPANNEITPITKTTSNNGTITFEKISPGSYELREVVGLAGYKKNNSVWKVEVDTEGNLVMTDANGNVMDRNASTNNYYVIENEPIEVSVSKTDINGKEIAGATLEITDAEGNTVEKWESVEGETKVVNLAAGTYTLHESGAPENYIVASDIKFVVDEYGKVKVAGEDVEKVTMVDDYKLNEVIISKVVLGQGDELAGATLTVSGTRFDGTEIETIEWVTDGTEHKIELAAGEYTLTETSCPDGYLKAEAIDFTVAANGTVTVGGENVAKVVMEDDFTKVTISKTDITNGKEIGGAKLVITDKDGNVVEEWISVEGESHYINAKLVAGETYTLTEITAPDGYEVAESIEFTVGTDGVEQVINMQDAPVEEEIVPPATPEDPKPVKDVVEEVLKPVSRTEAPADAPKGDDAVQSVYEIRTADTGSTATADNSVATASASTSKGVATGDDNMIALLVALMSIAAAGLYVLIRRRMGLSK